MSELAVAAELGLQEIEAGFSRRFDPHRAQVRTSSHAWLWRQWLMPADRHADDLRYSDLVAGYYVGGPALVLSAAIQELHRFHGLHPDPEGLGSPCRHPHGQLSNDAAGFASCYGPLSRSPFEGPSTLGFDPAGFPTKPPVCYRASWQLPGPDSHRQTTTS